jgi:hypothetical protein
MESEATLQKSFYEDGITLTSKPEKDTKKENYRTIFLLTLMQKSSIKY